jgi:hypothetical protein
VQTSHREKVEEFNRFLDELPEHFDIPRGTCVVRSSSPSSAHRNACKDTYTRTCTLAHTRLCSSPFTHSFVHSTHYHTPSHMHAFAHTSTYAHRVHQHARTHTHVYSTFHCSCAFHSSPLRSWSGITSTLSSSQCCSGIINSSIFILFLNTQSLFFALLQGDADAGGRPFCKGLLALYMSSSSRYR